MIGWRSLLSRHAPIVGLGLWAVVGVATRGGASIGAPGLAWLGPFLTVAVGVRLLRFHGVLMSGALPVAALPYGTRPPEPPRSETLGRLLLPLGSALVVGIAAHSAGAALVAAVSVTVLGLVVAPRRHLTLVGLAGALATVALLSPLLNARSAPFAEWVHPSSRSARSRGHLQEALWGASSGGVWGTGLGLGQTDAIPRPGGALFAGVAEDLGAVGCITVLLGYVVLVWRFCRVSVRARDDDGRLLGVGLASLLASQAFLGAAGALGLTPLLDVPLPFASDSRLCQCAWFGALGLVLALSKSGGRTALGTDRRSFRRGVRALAVGTAVAVLGAVGLRVAWVLLFRADRIAGEPLRITSRTATEVIENPRLLAMAARVQRGSIYDSQERVLATSDLREISASLPGDGDGARRFFRAGRYYPHGAAAAPIVGLWRPDSGAVGGIEREFDKHLRGYDGLAELVESYRNKDLPTWESALRPRGGDVILTIDAAMQDAAFRVLGDHCQANGVVGRGSLVVLHALQGHPVAAASLPSADPNSAVLARAGPVTEQGLPVVATDRARIPVPAPGPLFKVAVALAVPPEHLGARFVCDHAVGPLTWAGGQPPDAPATILDDPRDQAHRAIGLERALRVSCNVYFAQLAIRVGARRLYAGVSGIVGAESMPAIAEFARRLPYIMATGESAYLSPMQVAAVVATATSASSPVEPVYWFQQRFRDGWRPKYAKPAVPGGDSVGGLAGSSGVVRDALTETVREGPLAEVFAPLNRDVAGRTASVPRPGGGPLRDAWFAGYVPAESPAYVVACLIEGGGSGYRTASPASRDIMHDIP